MNKKLRFILLTAVVGTLLVWGIRDWGNYLILGLNPFVGLFVASAILAGFIFSVVVAARWLRRRAAFTTGDWFWVAFAGWMFGALYDELTGSRSTLDIQLHDTYFVIANLHICLWFALVFGAFGLFYHYNRWMGRRLGMIHFWMTLLGSLMFVAPAPGAEAMPRGYMDHTNWVLFDSMGMYLYRTILVWLLVPGLVAQGVFLVNVVYSMVGGRKSVD